MKNSLLPLLGLTLLLTGCDSPFKSKPAEIHTREIVQAAPQEQTTDDVSEQILDSQEEIKTTVDEIKQTNEDIKATNETILEVQQDIAEDVAITQMNTANLEMKMTAAESLKIRNDVLEKLNKEKDMIEKINHAVSFVEHLEFQLFTNSGVKTYNVEKQLEDKRKEAIDELAARVKPLAKKLKGGIFKKGMTGFEGDNDSKSFFALAVALHAVNSNQAEFRQFVGVPVETVLDIIINGLGKRDTPSAELKSSEKAVLAEEQTFALLVEARHKYFPVLALSQMSNFENGVLGKLDMKFTKWQPIFLKKKNRVDFNQEQIINLEVMLNDALKAKNALASVGIESKLPKKTIKIYKHMDLSVSEKIKPDLSGDVLNAITELEKKAIELLSADQAPQTGNDKAEIETDEE